ncbi:MAG TPA: tRNA lysidine(34) synthetase TilS, partial [Candidatus Limnocylindrales bacterium]|nr:tRNA lysidine(34) synthetase TilS [Candidatus Limnocylindrales bacterium]
PSATTPLDALASLVADGGRAARIPADAVLVLAVSGGPDSMAMLHGAARSAATLRPGWTLSVAHLDHDLRGGSATDAGAVVRASTALGLPCEVRRVDVAALARDEGRSIEDAGREARYRFLEEVAPEGAVIATAHTADDAAETVLLNLLRGSGLHGARGIPRRRGRVVRPLLDARRPTLRELLDGAGIAYVDDPSNADPAYLRNRVRGELIPLLEAIRPGAIDRIGAFARLAADDDALLDEIAAAELARRRQDDGAVDWRDPPARALGRRVLRAAIDGPGPSAERIEAMLDAAEGDRGGIRIELGGGRFASVRERRIRLI